MSATNPDTNPAEEFDTQLSSTLTQLSDLLANKEFLLATAQGDGEISKTALDAVKSIFDLGKSHLFSPRGRSKREPDSDDNNR